MIDRTKSTQHNIIIHHCYEMSKNAITWYELVHVRMFSAQLMHYGINWRLLTRENILTSMVVMLKANTSKVWDMDMESTITSGTFKGGPLNYPKNS